MKVENRKIVEITENELFHLYLDRGIDDIYSFPQYVEMFKKAGCVMFFYASLKIVLKIYI